mmetsp:Transcript_27335/g.83098  ORF Transcript_27335/g.83098 Transcript_27335/m.83098 type:complete len:333 (+) Transcript_27335:1699-2697(+)
MANASPRGSRAPVTESACTSWRVSAAASRSSPLPTSAGRQRTRPARRPQPPKRPAASSGRSKQRFDFSWKSAMYQKRCSRSRGRATSPSASSAAGVTASGDEEHGSPRPPRKMRPRLGDMVSCPPSERTTRPIHHRPGATVSFSALRPRLRPRPRPPEPPRAATRPSSAGCSLRCALRNLASAALAAALCMASAVAHSHVASFSAQWRHLTRSNSTPSGPTLASRTRSTSMQSCRRASSPSSMLSAKSPTLMAEPPSMPAQLPAGALRCDLAELRGGAADCTSGHAVASRSASAREGRALPLSLTLLSRRAIMYDMSPNCSGDASSALAQWR